MTTDDALEYLEEIPEEGERPVEEARTERYFLFSVGDSRFALPPSAIREIVADLEVFPLPACPPYVAGLINCHGTPYTVFDLRVLFESERMAVTQFLVLKAEGDEIAFGCTSVDEIAEVSVDDVTELSEADADAGFCAASAAIGGERVPVLDVGRIQKRLEIDLA